MAAASGTARVVSIPTALVWQVAALHLMRSLEAWGAKTQGIRCAGYALHSKERRRRGQEPSVSLQAQMASATLCPQATPAAMELALHLSQVPPTMHSADWSGSRPAVLHRGPSESHRPPELPQRVSTHYAARSDSRAAGGSVARYRSRHRKLMPIPMRPRDR